MTQYPHGVADSTNQGTFMIAEGEGEQYMYWSHQKSKLAESESNPATQQFRVTGYEWI
jgi:hypothetical protein